MCFLPPWTCPSNYCVRYRPDARQPQEIDLAARTLVSQLH
jgi:hypothetical protein